MRRGPLRRPASFSGLSGGRGAAVTARARWRLRRARIAARLDLRPPSRAAARVVADGAPRDRQPALTSSAQAASRRRSASRERHRRRRRRLRRRLRRAAPGDGRCAGPPRGLVGRRGDAPRAWQRPRPRRSRPGRAVLPAGIGPEPTCIGRTACRRGGPGGSPARQRRRHRRQRGSRRPRLLPRPPRLPRQAERRRREPAAAPTGLTRTCVARLRTPSGVLRTGARPAAGCERPAARPRVQQARQAGPGRRHRWQRRWPRHQRGAAAGCRRGSPAPRRPRRRSPPRPAARPRAAGRRRAASAAAGRPAPPRRTGPPRPASRRGPAESPSAARNRAPRATVRLSVASTRHELAAARRRQRHATARAAHTRYRPPAGGGPRARAREPQAAGTRAPALGRAASHRSTGATAAAHHRLDPSASISPREVLGARTARRRSRASRRVAARHSRTACLDRSSASCRRRRPSSTDVDPSPIVTAPLRAAASAQAPSQALIPHNRSAACLCG